MGIKHTDVKATGQKGFASEWNKNHVVDSDVPMANNKLTGLSAGAAAGDSVRFEQVAIKSGTYYLTIPGHHFKPTSPDVDAHNMTIDQAKITINAGVKTYASVNLPHGAIITGVVVYGSNATKSFTLIRALLTDGSTRNNLGNATIGTEDTTIDNPTVDNQTYSYYISTTTLTAGDRIYGARITYTL